MYPNSKKWLLPVMVLSDPLHPEMNGQVKVMDISKTLRNAIVGQNTPPNYFDPNAGFNFNVVVELQQSKDKTQWFPNYGRSGFDTSPTQINTAYIMEKLNEMGITDFAEFVKKLNDYFLKKNSQPASGSYQGQVSPQATTPPSAYGAGQVATQPVVQTAPVAAPVAAQPVPMATPVAAPVPTAVPQPVAVQPTATPVDPNQIPFESAPTVPQPVGAQQPVAQPVPQAQAAPDGEDFEAIFGTPNAPTS